MRRRDREGTATYGRKCILLAILEGYRVAEIGIIAPDSKLAGSDGTGSIDPNSRDTFAVEHCAWHNFARTSLRILALALKTCPDYVVSCNHLIPF